MNYVMQDKFICPCQGVLRAGRAWISPARTHPSPPQGSRADLEMLPGPTKSPGKFMLMRQVQDQAVKSIHRSESRSTGCMARRGHSCEGPGHRRSYNTLLAGTGRDDMGLLGPLCKVCGWRPPVKLVRASKGY